MPNNLDFEKLTVFGENNVPRGVDFSTSDPSDFNEKFVGPVQKRNDFQYPIDLGSIDLNHFVLFTIYESEGFKLEKVFRAIKDAAVLKSAEATNAFIKPKDGKPAISATTMEDLKVQANDSFGKASKSLETLTSNDKILHVTRVKSPLRRSLDTVAMYMPEKVQVSYGLQYEQDSLSTASTIRSFFNLFNDSSDKTAIISDLAEDIGVSTLSKLADSALGTIGLNPNIGSAIESKTHKVRNPHMEVLFKAVNNRSFNFTFNFKPRSRDESIMVHNIIKTFKKHALPKVSTGDKFLTHPSEFEITYFSNRSENRFLNRIARCVLTNIEIDYSAAGVFSTFDHDDSLSNVDFSGAAPTNIAISLSFMEVINIDTDFAKVGY